MKVESVFVCQECGAQSSKWLGRCPVCGGWNTMVEETRGERVPPAQTGDAAAVSLRDVEMDEGARMASGMSEVDRVLGGGFVPGEVALLGGDPGVGKSTLLLKVSGEIAGSRPVLYASGEESLQQVAARARRLEIDSEKLHLLSETNIEGVIAQAEKLDVGFLVVDSIQSAATAALSSTPGSIAQVRACAARVSDFAKSTGTPAVLIGHITKGGMIAGPKTLEHMVDAVLYLEGEKYRHLKVLRAQKNRFGATSEMALLEMTQRGLQAVENPSAALLADRPENAAGSVIGVAMQGTRPLLFEIQALTSPSAFGLAKRMSVGVDRNRVQLLSAVLERALHITLGDRDLFVNVVGGVALDEPALDLPLCLAIASSFFNRPLPQEMAAFGEVGLTGEVRAAGRAGERMSEALTLGFTRCVLPSTDFARLKEKAGSVNYTAVSTLEEAGSILFP